MKLCFPIVLPLLLTACAHRGELGLRNVASSTGDSASFLVQCQGFAEQQGFKAQVCADVHKKYFSKIDPAKAMAEFTPKELGAPAMGADAKIRFVAFNDALGAAALTYCYYVSKGALNDSIGPEQLAVASTGFSVTRDSLGAYEDWLGTEAGKKCRTKVEAETGYQFPNLKGELKESVAFIGVVPLAALYSGFKTTDTVEAEMKITVNHGRILAYVQSCPDLQAWGQKQWLSLSEQDRKVISSNLSGYKWDDVASAGRQYTAFTFEKEPTKILNLAKKCAW